jgi:integrase-like protein
MRVSDLIASYQTDEASAFAKCRYRTKKNYRGLLRHIEQALGDREVNSIRTRDLLLTHQLWMLRGTYMAHALVSMLRTVCSYGGTMLEDDACITLAGRMGAMRFPMGKPRSSRISAAQVVAIRREARRTGRYSIATCQALQFDLMLRQRDCLGEYVPLSEPGESDIIDGGFKWLRGITWQEIDANMILRHVTSKKQKEIEVNLTLAPMLMEELRFDYLTIDRKRLPERGPFIVDEFTGLPWNAWEFRRVWREIARACGISDEIRNMDTRAGAISEATDAGASLELVRHAATHSDVATTARYSRGSTDKIAEVMRLRAGAREAV